jgi:hypothetical protein
MRMFAHEILPGDMILGVYHEDRFMSQAYASIVICQSCKPDKISSITLLISEDDRCVMRRKIFLEDSVLEVLR